MRVFGDHDEATRRQLQQCVDVEDGARGVLCADGHLGYSMPIGGVVAYRDHVSPSGVDFDIGCGNKAVRTNLRHEQVGVAMAGPDTFDPSRTDVAPRADVLQVRPR